MPIAVLITGDPLYIGLWHYLAIPAFIIGVLGWGIGFFLNQLVACNTVMYCGPLTLPALL